MTSRSVDPLAAELARLRREYDDFRSTALARFPSSDRLAVAMARYDSSSSQTVSNLTNTYVSFGTTILSSPAVTRSTQGAGHRFTLNETGIWAITMTVRFDQELDGTGECYASIELGGSQVIAAQGGTSNGVSHTLNPTFVGLLSATNYVSGLVFQGTGSSRPLEGSPVWKNINLALLSRTA